MLAIMPKIKGIAATAPLLAASTKLESFLKQIFYDK